MTLSPFLEKIASSDRVGSAYLFTGPAPDLFRHQALLFAKRLNCEKNTVCDECICCKKIDRSSHPDLFLIKPDGHSIKIDMVRDLQKYLRYKPFEAKYKIAIIERAEELQMTSGNAMLKILEEPPPQTIFLLLTPHEEKILPTIISRCQIVRFSGTSLFPMDAEMSSFIRQLPKRPDDIFELAKEISKEEQGLENFLQTLLIWYQALIIYKIGGAPNHPIFKENESLAQSISENFTLRKLYERTDAILEAKQSLDFQVNRELLIEQLLIQLRPS